jgi:microcystin-dependent protein
MNTYLPFKLTLQKTSIVFVLSLLALAVRAQVGIDVASPHPSAVLDLNEPSNSKGVLVPSVTSAQREAIAAPADGLLVYDETQKMFYHWDAGINKWQAVNPFSYRKGSNPVDEENFVINLDNNKSVVIGNVATPTEKLEIGGNIRATGNITATGNLSANNITASSIVTSSNITVNNPGTLTGYGTIPLGGIIMWSGTTIPAGWALCNGDVNNGFRTPDLRGRFIVGYNPLDGDYNQPGNLSTKTVPPPPAAVPGNTGGLKEVTLTVAQMPTHSHGVTDGQHSHGYHDTYPNNDAESTTSGGLSWYIYRRGTTDAFRTTNSSSSNITINNAGGSQPHENRPPYYVLAFIMRVY